MRRQLALGAAALTTTVALAFLVPLGLMVRTVVEERAIGRADLTARSIAPVIAVTDDPALVAGAVASLTRADAQVAVQFEGQPLVGGPPPDPAHLASARGGRAFVARDDEGATTMLPVEGAGTGPAVIAVRVPADALRRGVGRAWALLALLGGLLVVVAVLLADRAARAIVVPVGALAHTSRRLAEGDLDARVDPAGPPEIAEVGQITNHLAARIGDLLVRERELVADLSHRLRTPLASLRLDAEQLPASESAQRVRDDVDLLERGLNDLIRQARRQPPGSAPVTDVRAVLLDRAGFWAALADEQERPWTVTAHHEPLYAAVDPEDLAAALDALLGNVFAHTPERTPCRIALARDQDQATIVIADEGPGFPSDLGARGDSPAGSTGLGLDIARRTAEDAGGRLRARNEPSGGARVELTFPLAGRPGVRGR